LKLPRLKKQTDEYPGNDRGRTWLFLLFLTFPDTGRLLYRLRSRPPVGMWPAAVRYGLVCRSWIVDPCAL